MRITYRIEANIVDLEKLVKEAGFRAEYEKQSSLEEIKEGLKSYRGPAIGSPLPEGWIDLGNHLYSFILSKEFAEAVIRISITQGFFHGVIKPLYKKVFSNRSNASDIKRSICIITDEFSIDSEYTIFFVIYDDLNDDQLNNALQKLSEVRQKLLDLLELAHFAGGETIRVAYLGGKWSIQRFETSIDNKTDPEIANFMYEYLDSRKPSTLKLFYYRWKYRLLNFLKN